MYNPKPINTEDINLSSNLLELTEEIAANVHDVWVAGRISEGWTYGDVKDADKKTTPLLVPYNELPESEKEYDRNTALRNVAIMLTTQGADENAKCAVKGCLRESGSFEILTARL